MAIRIVEESPDSLRRYATIPISFLVERRFVVLPIDGGLAGLHLAIEPVKPPYVKDYDLDPGEGPAHWGANWDISHWGIMAAFDGDRQVGGTAAETLPSVEVFKAESIDGISSKGGITTQHARHPATMGGVLDFRLLSVALAPTGIG